MLGTTEGSDGGLKDGVAAGSKEGIPEGYVEGDNEGCHFSFDLVRKFRGKRSGNSNFSS